MTASTIRTWTILSPREDLYVPVANLCRPRGATRMSAHRSVEEIISAIDDEQVARDSRTLVEMMRRISGHEPQIWNVATIGFGTYHYVYETGRQGDGHIIGFYPRKGRITIYLMDGTVRHGELLSRLGKHTSSRVCLYLRRLADVDLAILELIVRESHDYVKSLDGRMHRALE